ncbi:MAG: response regulator transcription factor [Thermodesulfobacteriota bacterium]
MKPILIIEDEKDIVDLLAYHLKQNNFPVIFALDGPSGLEKAQKELPALIILDLMLPGMDGKDICRALKNNPSTQSIPILMLTAKTEEVDRVVGFELGADDYVTKPFSFKELVLRVKAILRRTEKPPADRKALKIGDLFIDAERYYVSFKKNPIKLTSTEFKLLFELATNKGRVLNRDQLLDKVWDYTYEGYSRTIDTHIRRLREKLGLAGDYIETIRGIGYRLRDE